MGSTACIEPHMVDALLTRRLRSLTTCQIPSTLDHLQAAVDGGEWRMTEVEFDWIVQVDLCTSCDLCMICKCSQKLHLCRLWLDSQQMN